MVKTGRDGYKRVDYTRMTPVLVEAVKEQQAQIEKLKAENSKMKEEIAQIKSLLEIKAQK
jgi:cell division protein FtsB